jgi:hypothetical protein
MAGGPQGELAVKNADLAVATRSAEAMLHEISASTAVAEKEKSKVAVIVSDVSNTAAARPTRRPLPAPAVPAGLSPYSFTVMRLEARPRTLTRRGIGRSRGGRG